MTHRTPSIRFKKVTKSFVEHRTKKEITVFENFDLELTGQQILVLLGPSGCGKTTLLKMMAGLIAPDTGEIEVMEKPIQPNNPSAITIFQDYSLFPWLTALENVVLPLQTKTWGKDHNRKTRYEEARKALRKVRLQERLNAYPSELSGGMQQRVALARSVVVKPPILLMDEPFGALDARIRSEMQSMLGQLWQEEQNLVIFVTHDIDEALILAQRIVVLSRRTRQKPSRIIGNFVVDAPLARDFEFLFEDTAERLREKIWKKLYEV